MLEVFSAVGRLVLDDQASDALDKVEGKAEKTSSTLGQKLGGGFKTAGKLAVGFAAGVGVVAAGATALVTNLGNMADGILDSGDKMLWSTDAVQKWNAVATVAGIEAGVIEKANQKLMTSWNQVGESGGKAKDAVEDLGLSFSDLDAMAPDQRFDMITNALAGIEDPVERARLGTELMGKAYYDMAPAIGMGADELERVKDNANVFTPEQLQRANDMRIKFDQVKEKAGFLVMELAMKLLPVFETFFEWVDEHMPAIEQFFDDAFTFIAEVVETMKPLFNNFLIPLLKTTFEWIGKALKALQDFWNKWGTDITRIVKTSFDTVSNIIKGVLDVIKGIFNVFVGLFTGDWQRMNSGLEQLWRGFWNVITNIVRGAWGMLSGAFSSVWQSISGWFSNLGRDAYSWGRNMIQGFVNGIRAMIGQVTDAANSVVNAAKNFLGFRSPTKEGEGRYIEDWGSGMVEGFMDGMENAMPGLHNMMRGMVPNLEPSFNMSGSAAVGGGITIQNMNVRNDNDIKLIARELYQLQRRESRGGGRA